MRERPGIMGQGDGSGVTRHRNSFSGASNSSIPASGTKPSSSTSVFTALPCASPYARWSALAARKVRRPEKMSMAPHGTITRQSRMP